MNNDYDRELPSPTGSTGAVELMIESIDQMSNNDPVVKLVLLKNNETIIAEVRESIDGSSVQLIDPRVVLLQAARPSDDGQTTTTAISYTDWLPLSESRNFTIDGDYVVLITDPIESLVQSYTQARQNG
ncbi:hypothetical protein Syn7803C34_161 [Synechococcus phage ACG-2014f]|uniref:Uncharacterized protein n=1 Tax=Synechococcus phage ACG-2014f TaxID=1493511 RepID=A0A0E3HI49_9CAUD|nr:hypothetical protein Syn7803US17_163 [Synechococcus phage ACG-2014f]AIX28730.1 hypothetical protein Syn7803US24_163 [Synechococcus phage ACG-2014f]AIX30353.1 hypothetical protein Syn7803US36_165 [Synechococcus phage ACG-2014f]AIX32364.1 hypothetical protein Syn7803US44_164 [Synechococcus phage ACG-2014f]AIX45712.1 hypothetical protein Syn7803C34_161 [Synechococcus phage ACG-2014f]